MGKEFGTFACVAEAQHSCPDQNMPGFSEGKALWRPTHAAAMLGKTTALARALRSKRAATILLQGTDGTLVLFTQDSATGRDERLYVGGPDGALTLTPILYLEVWKDSGRMEVRTSLGAMSVPASSFQSGEAPPPIWQGQHCLRLAVTDFEVSETSGTATVRPHP